MIKMLLYKHNRKMDTSMARWILVLMMVFFCQIGAGYIHDQDRGYNLGHRQEEQEPYFDLTASKNVTALKGKSAELNCRVKNRGNRTVSWVRHRDTHLLSTNRYTYTSDQRFQIHHRDHTDDWTLEIKYAQHRDAGIYECQISTTPHRSLLISLSVVEPRTEILGGPDLYIDKGSTINLTCVVKFSPDPPRQMVWKHNTETINYDSPRGGVSVITEKGDITTSYLLIQKARSPDTGKYSCNPSNSPSKTINVHVLDGEHPAAMQHSGCTQNIWSLTVLLSLGIYFLAS